MGDETWSRSEMMKNEKNKHQSHHNKRYYLEHKKFYPLPCLQLPWLMPHPLSIVGYSLDASPPAHTHHVQTIFRRARTVNTRPTNTTKKKWLLRQIPRMDALCTVSSLWSAWSRQVGLPQIRPSPEVAIPTPIAIRPVPERPSPPPPMHRFRSPLLRPTDH